MIPEVTPADLLTLVGLTPIVMVFVEMTKRLLALTDAAIGRFGPVLSIGSGILLALAAAGWLTVQGTVVDFGQAALTGFVAGALSRRALRCRGRAARAAASSGPPAAGSRDLRLPRLPPLPARARARLPAVRLRGVRVMPGKKYASIKRPAQYEALRKKGMPKAMAAKISNSKAPKK